METKWGPANRTPSNNEAPGWLIVRERKRLCNVAVGCQRGRGFTCDFSRGSLVTSREEAHL